MRSRCGFRGDHHRLGRRHAELLANRDAVARRRARAIDAQLPGARPFRDGGEAGVGQMPLEPAIEPDAVVIGRDGELADGKLRHAVALTSASPATSAATEPRTLSAMYADAAAS